VGRGSLRTIETDPKRAVADGYDQIAEAYAAWKPAGPGSVKDRYLRLVLDRLTDGARVLDLGCGTGAQVTRPLAERHWVVGVDRSPRSVALARLEVPRARFVLADLARVAFAAGSFDAVIAFFSLIHVPREEHASVLADVARWLRPGGSFVVTLGVAPQAEDWGSMLGARLFWSSWDREANLRLVAEAGLTIDTAVDETEDEDGVPFTHLWVTGRR
jgi:SAM-dependent methyltransferase